MGGGWRDEDEDLGDGNSTGCGEIDWIVSGDGGFRGGMRTIGVNSDETVKIGIGKVGWCICATVMLSAITSSGVHDSDSGGLQGVADAHGEVDVEDSLGDDFSDSLGLELPDAHGEVDVEDSLGEDVSDSRRWAVPDWDTDGEVDVEEAQGLDLARFLFVLGHTFWGRVWPSISSSFYTNKHVTILEVCLFLYIFFLQFNGKIVNFT